MKKLLILIFLIQISMTAQNGQKNFIDLNYIEVIGKVETEIVPNEIYLTIIINEKDKRVNISVEQQEKIMLKKLKASGVNLEKQLSVLDFMGNYTKHFFKKNGVTKRKEYQLIIYNSNNLGEIFQSLDEIDISNVSISKVNHSEMDKFRKETKIKALKAAKEKAKNYAEAIEQNIGKALFIQEQNVPNYNNRNYGLNTLNEVVVVRGYGTSKKDKIQNNISFQKIKITASILARFELK